MTASLYEPLFFESFADAEPPENYLPCGYCVQFTALSKTPWYRIDSPRWIEHRERKHGVVDDASDNPGHQYY